MFCVSTLCLTAVQLLGVLVLCGLGLYFWLAFFRKP